MMQKTPNLQKNEIVFFFANYYSGATLLAFFLNNHKRLVCNGETFPFIYSESDSYTCSCGQKIKRCNFYRHCAEQFCLDDNLSEKYKNFSIFPTYSTNQFLNKFVSTLTVPHHLRKTFVGTVPSLKAQHNLFLKLHVEFIEKACQYYGVNIYIDNTKSIQRCELFLDFVGPNKIKIIHLIRDGRAYFHSYRKTNPTTPESREFIARKWQGYLNEIARLRSANPGIQLLNVRYEDLCENPALELKKMCDFLAVEFDENMFKRQQCDHHILGNKMRFGFDWSFKENSTIPWQQELTSSEIALCNRLQKNGLREFSYL